MGTTFTVAIPFGRGHLPQAQVVPAGGPRAVAAGASPFLLEAMRWLPAADPPEPAETGSADGGPRRARVLLADDNADMREYLQRLLRPDYRVTAVTWAGTDQVTVTSTGPASRSGCAPSRPRTSSG